VQKPRSIYIAFDVFPRPKGSSSHVAAMVRALAGGHGPVWLLCLGVGDMPSYQEEDGVVIHRYNIYHPNLLTRAAGFGEFVAQMTARAGDEVELIVFRDPWGGAPALAAGGDAVAIFEVNALPSWELPYTYPGVRHNYPLLEKLRDLERYCLLHSDLILTVSSVTREALAGLGADPDRITVIPNSASDYFLNASARACPLPQLESGEWIGYVGSLHPWQGLETLIDALALAAPARPDARLLVVHNGTKARLKPLRKRVHKRGLDDRVVFHDPLPPAELGAVMARLRFTAAPLAETGRNTLQGCCPVKIIESMAVGTPVLASDLRVCRELVRDREDGILLAAHQPRAWARAIIALLAEPDRAKALGQKAKARAERDYAGPVIRARLERSFCEAISGRDQK
jgi:glycosyltransferase involved in cell wall biosynthesis